MAAEGWRYFAQRLDGDGGAEMIHTDLPLSGVSITTTLSGPDGMSATITPEVAALLGDDGRPVFREWSTALWAEKDGEIRGGGILAHTGVKDASLSLECVGPSGYLKDMPYTLSQFFVEADPLDIARHIWSHVQSQPGGDLGVTLDQTTSPVRIGTELRQVEFDTQEGPVAFEAGPYKLAWYQTHDLQSNFDGLAAETPFEYREQASWDGDRVAMHIRLGYPTIGARQDGLRFVIGENVSQVPSLEFPGEEFANEVIVLGAGEGSTMVRGDLSRPGDGRLRRVAVVQDKQIRSRASAIEVARFELARRIGEFSVTDIAVRDHPHAEIGSWQTGDEIFVAGDAGWVEMGVWCRVLSTTISPESPDIATLSILRTDKVSL